MKLFYHPLSGHSHRARLFLSLAGQAFEPIEVDLMKGEHKQPEFLKLNSFGQVPVLVDGDTVIQDSNGIMIYIAKKLGKTDWLPEDALGAARVQRWLSIAAGQLAFGPAAARLITVFGAKFNPDEVIGRAHALLGVVEEELSRSKWLAADHITIADLAIYSYTARAPEGNVDLSAYPNVGAWLARIEQLPGFIPFVKTPVGLTAAA
jgi:glutathione S-transferase